MVILDVLVSRCSLSYPAVGEVRTSIYHNRTVLGAWHLGRICALLNQGSFFFILFNGLPCSLQLNFDWTSFRFTESFYWAYTLILPLVGLRSCLRLPRIASGVGFPLLSRPFLHPPAFYRKDLIHPTFEYWSHVWRGASTVALPPLNWVQRKAVRLINCSSLTCSSLDGCFATSFLPLLFLFFRTCIAVCLPVLYFHSFLMRAVSNL